jgi:hypothetical protein
MPFQHGTYVMYGIANQAGRQSDKVLMAVQFPGNL